MSIGFMPQTHVFPAVRHNSGMNSRQIGNRTQSDKIQVVYQFCGKQNVEAKGGLLLWEEKGGAIGNYLEEKSTEFET